MNPRRQARRARRARTDALVILVGVALLSALAALLASLIWLASRRPHQPDIPPILALPSLTASPSLPEAQATPTPSPSPTRTPTATPTPSATPTITPTPYPPRLDDFWEGRAIWVLDVFDVGLPPGESDTVAQGGNVYWSYLHASSRSAGVIDQCGAPAPFPGCVTVWTSYDAGRSFSLPAPVCLIPCARCPCDAELDHVQQQQYPRVAVSADGVFYMVYEWGARIMLRTSVDRGFTWSPAEHVPGTGIWPLAYGNCSPLERIDPHPFVGALEWDCLVGAPPGIYVDGEELYIFVDLGNNPAHLGCLRGNRFAGAAGLRRCDTTPLFSGAATYGPLDATGPAANPYFDFRYVSSADVVRDGDRYYMTYEGVRGPGPGDPGDTQFGLGFARSSGPAIDVSWEKYPGNPILSDLPGSIGLGHADLIAIDGTWYLYTATGTTTRGRYRLAWR